MNTVSNPQIELAYNYVNYTNKHIFLTGNAGTGKTTFLRKIKEEALKRLAVVAPTGVAAINAQGVTIHSLFQLPFGPLVPGQLRKEMRTRRFTKKKINLLRSLDLLIIDEISMVRADVLDAMDEVLRRYRRNSKPFGGVQLLMIGDLHQLPPVVRPEDWDMLRMHYETMYFFGSLALRQTDVVTIELKHIYRQVDTEFIALLNKVRANKMTNEVFHQLNTRYQPNFQPDDKDGYITLTSHNATAYQINNEKLKAVKGASHFFEAEIEDHFPEHAFPTDEKLEFKIGAQVMFIKNDISADKLYFNGKIGHIVGFDKDAIIVKCPDDDFEIEVGMATWRNVKYTLNEATKEIREDLLGTFSQYPLKLAWAITIHKSQGLTFDRVVIDAADAFAHGQVYVALSRCKSFEGIVLRTQIGTSSVKTDRVVSDYTEDKRQNQPGLEELNKAKRDYQQNLLLELFNFKRIKNAFAQLHREILMNENSLTGSIEGDLQAIVPKAGAKIFSLSEKFIPQLHQYFAQESLPEDNDALQDRMRKASRYFMEQLQLIFDESQNLEILSDNKAVKEKVKERHDDLLKEIAIKKACFESCKYGFNTNEYVEAQANAEIDYELSRAKRKPKKKSPKDAVHPKLYDELAKWRAATASQNGVELYNIAPTKTLLEIVEVLPTSKDALNRIHGVGKKRLQQFGEDIIDIVTKFSLANQLPTDLLQFSTGKAPKKPKPPKPDTKVISLELFQSGKSVAEVAKERGLKDNTIYGHLAHFIEKGELDINEVIPKESIQDIIDYIENNKIYSLSQIRTHFDEKYSYGEINIALAEQKRNAE